MSIIEIVLLAIGLSMDSLAVSVTGGAVIRNCTVCNMVKIGSFMGITQATMTVLGYLAGVGFQKYITAFDHWIAFGLQNESALQQNIVRTIHSHQYRCAGYRYLVGNPEIGYRYPGIPDRYRHFPDVGLRRLFRKPLRTESRSETRSARRTDPDRYRSKNINRTPVLKLIKEIYEKSGIT